MKMINRDYLQKKPRESLSKKEKGKWNNVIMNNTKIYQKMESKILFSIGKKDRISVKMLYYDYKTLFLKVVSQKMRLMKNRLKLNFTIYFEKAI